MKSIEQLINNLNGQLNGIKKMINADQGCFEVIVQFKAVKSGLNKVMDKYLAEKMDKCLNGGIKQEKLGEMRKLISELSKK